MLKKWWLDQVPEGNVELRRVQSRFGCSPGWVFPASTPPLLEFIDLSWTTCNNDNTITFTTNFINCANVEDAAIIAPSNSIAGLFHFVVDKTSRKIRFVSPGPVDPQLIISATSSDENGQLGSDYITSSDFYILDSHRAAIESAHEIWNEICNLPWLLNTSAASTPSPIQLGSESLIQSHINYSTQCNIPFVDFLIKSATELSNDKLQQFQNDAEAGEQVGGENYTEHHHSSYPHVFGQPHITTSSYDRALNSVLRRQERTHTIDEIASTVQAIVSQPESVEIEGATDTRDYTMLYDPKHCPYKIIGTRIIRSTFTFASRLYLATGVTFSSTWLIWPNSPFKKKSTFKKQLKAFNDQLQTMKSDIFSQYMPKQKISLPLTLLIEAAFRVCKPERCDTLSAEDIAYVLRKTCPPEKYNDKLVHDTMYELDPDGSSTIEYNEFYLYCHTFDCQQLRTLGAVSVPALVEHDKTWTKVFLDLDASICKLYVYFDLSVTKMSILERQNLESNQKSEVWGPLAVLKVSTPEHCKDNLITLFTSIGDLKFKLGISNFSRFLKIAKWIERVNKPSCINLAEVSPTIILELAHSAILSIPA